MEENLKNMFQGSFRYCRDFTPLQYCKKKATNDCSLVA
jgi:hypothetical protein